ncbi:hypothetical protein FKM82_006911 [Ascaphus truei]
MQINGQKSIAQFDTSCPHATPKIFDTMTLIYNKIKITLSILLQNPCIEYRDPTVFILQSCDDWCVHVCGHAHQHIFAMWICYIF